MKSIIATTILLTMAYQIANAASAMGYQYLKCSSKQFPKAMGSFIFLDASRPVGGLMQLHLNQVVSDPLKQPSAQYNVLAPTPDANGDIVNLAKWGGGMLPTADNLKGVPKYLVLHNLIYNLQKHLILNVGIYSTLANGSLNPNEEKMYVYTCAPYSR